MEATALRERGWSISAIARHLGRDRKTVRAYLNGEKDVGVRKKSTPDPFVEFIPYLRARFQDDKHLWASALYDEVAALGFPLSYQSFTRGLRHHELRPHCEACDGAAGRSTIEIDHPAGEEIVCGVPHRISYVESGIMRRHGRTSSTPAWSNRWPLLIHST